MNLAALDLEEDLLVTAFNVAKVGICFTAEDGRFVRVNPAFCEMTGFRADDLVGHPWTLAAPPEIAADAGRFYGAVLKESPRLPREWCIRKKNGELLDVLVGFKPVLRADGSRVVVFTFTDIGNRIQAEEQLKESETRFREIAENINEVLWIIDPREETILYTNPTYEKVFGRSAESLYREPQSFIAAIHPDDRAKVIAAMPELVSKPHEVEYRVVRPDGAVRWIHDRAFPVRNEHGEVYRVTGIATDITEEKRAQEEIEALNRDLEHRVVERTAELTAANERLNVEIAQHQRTAAALSQSEEAFRLAATAGRMGAWDCDPVKKTLRWTGAIAEFFGTEPGLFEGTLAEFLARVHPDDQERLNRKLAHHLEHPEAGDLVDEYRVVTPSGEVHWVGDWGRVYRDAEGRPLRIAGIGIDITERKRHEVELAERAELVLRHRNVLLDLARRRDEPVLERAIERILAEDAKALQVERVSFCTFRGDPPAADRATVYSLSRQAIDPSEATPDYGALTHPRYFAALAACAPIVAHRAQEDPATSEFTADYLKPLGITSMLDVAVWSRGRMAGVLCHEHVGPPREWTPEEIDFAAAIGSMISIALEADHRQRLMQALAASEEKYRRVVENANEGIMVAQEGYVRFANPKTVELFGVPAEKLFATPLEDFVHPDDRARVMGDLFPRLCCEPVHNDRPFRIVDGQGQVKWLRTNAVSFDWEGNPATLNFLFDITEKRQLQQNLAQTLAERETILGTAPVGIAHLVDRRILWVSPQQGRQMFGYNNEEIIGRDVRMLYADSEEYARVGAEAYSALAAGRSYETEVRMRRKDGTDLWCAISGKAIDPADPSKGSIWIMTDISEQKRLREELARTLAEREAILQSTVVGVTVAVERKHQWVNDTLAGMLGYAPEELIGQTSEMHFPDRESWVQFGRRAYPVLASGEGYMQECEMRRKDGSLIWCLVYGKALDSADLGKGSIWTFIDITEHKRADEEIHRALERERELNELKSRFVAMTSHEFRTPLATILSSAELLEDYGDRLPDQEKTELAGLIKSSVERMTGMLNDVLLIGKADAQRIELNPHPTDLATFCESVVEEIRRSDRNGHPIRFERRGEREVRSVDQEMLRHILANVLDNAVKYSPAGTEVRLSLDCRDDAAVFEVADRGIGIPPEDQPRVFDSFNRGRNVRDVSGTGLGLAIVKKLVEQHGGTIRFDSQVGRGTRFVVTIPDGAEHRSS